MKADKSILDIFGMHETLGGGYSEPWFEDHFTVGNFSFSMLPGVIVRVPGRLDEKYRIKPDEWPFLPSTIKLVEDIEPEGGTAYEFMDKSLSSFLGCEFCTRLGGEMIDCPECNGGYGEGCEDCDFDGKILTHKTETCPECYGSETPSFATVKLDVGVFCARMIYLLDKLPGLAFVESRVVPYTDKTGFQFYFDGGAGFVMVSTETR